MNINHKSLRLKLMLGTALVGTSIAGFGGLTTDAHAQTLVDVGDLKQVRVPGEAFTPGTGGKIDVTTNIAQDLTEITVLEQTVIAEWNQFHVPVDTTLRVTKDSNLTVATLLNRVVGDGMNPIAASTIDGRIETQDVNFWLINEGGILFGNDAYVTGKSLVFSTLDTTDADFFSFVEDTLVNDTADTIRFNGGLGSGIQADTGARFVSDGSLWFVSEDLDLDAGFSSENQSVAFITAKDTQVRFTPGSPLQITVSQGSTIASSQSISGNVTAPFVTFHMATDTDVITNLLSVDAKVTANNAVMGEDGAVMLVAQAIGAGASAPGIAGSGDIFSDGLVDIDSANDINVTGDIRGAGVALDAAGMIDAASIAAIDGDVEIEAVGDITTTSISAMMSGAIDVDSTGGGNLNLGDIFSTGGGEVDFDTTGTLTLGTVNIESDLFLGRPAQPSEITIGGKVTALSFDAATGGAFASQAIETSAGRITIDASSIDTNGQALDATDGRVGLLAQGSIDTGKITSTGAGALINVDSTVDGNLTLGNLSSTGDITLDTAGTITTGSINSAASPQDPAPAADTVGRLIIGGSTVGSSDMPSAVTIGGRVIADLVTVDSAGDISATSVISRRSTTLSAGGSLAFSSVNAGDNATLTADTSINGGSVTAGNNAVLDAGTTLTATAVKADNFITATSDGDMNLASAVADGNVTLTTVTTPSNSVGNITVTGTTSGAKTIIDSEGAATLAAVTSTAGNLTINAVDDIETASLRSTGGSVRVETTMGSIMAANVTSDVDATLSAVMGAIEAGNVAANGDVTATSDGALELTSANADDDSDDAGSLSLTTTTGLIDVDGASSGVEVTINSGDSANLGSVSTSGGLLDIDAVNDITTDNLRAVGGNVDVTSDSGSITTLNAASDNDVVMEASAGDIETGLLDAAINATLTADGSIDFAKVEADNDATLAAGDDILGGDLSAGNDATITAGEMINAGAISAGNDLTATSGTDLELMSATANAGDPNALGADNLGDLTLISTNGTLTVTGTSTGVATTITSTSGDASLGDVRSTGGPLAITANGSVSTMDVRATGGDATITATTGSITTRDVTSDDANVVMTASTLIDTKNVMADIDATLTAGTINYESVSANGNATLGAGDDISGGDVFAGIDATLTAGETITAGEVRANNDVTLDAGGSINFGSVIAGNDALLDTGADIIGLLDGAVIAGNDVTLTAAGMIALGAISADNNLTATSGTDMTLMSAVADFDNTGGGNLELTSTNGTLTVTGASKGVETTITSTSGDAALGDVRSTGGLLAITADGSIRTADVSATGGNAQITSTTSSITTQDVTSVGDSVVMNAATSIVAQDIIAGADAMLTAGTSITAGDVKAGNDATFDAGTSLTTGAISADNNITATSGTDMTLMSAAADSDDADGGNLILTSTDGTLTVSDTSRGVETTITSTNGDASLGDVRSTGGLLTVTANGSVMTDTVRATGGDAQITATTGSITTLDVTSDDANVVMTASTLIDTQNVKAGENATLTAGTINYVSVSADNNATLDAGDDISGGDVFAGNDAILTADDMITAGEVRANNDVTATSGGAMSLMSARADDDGSSVGALTLTSTGGSVNVDDLSSGVTVTIDSDGPATAMDGTALSGVTLGDVTSTGGLIDIDAVASVTTGILDATGGDVQVTSAESSVTTLDAISDANVDLSAMTDIDTQNVRATSNAMLDADGSVSYASVEAVDAMLDAGASITGGDVTATNDATLMAGEMIDAGAITAANDITATSGTGMTLASASADIDESNAGALTLTNGEGVLQVTGASSGTSVTVAGGTGAVSLGNAGEDLARTQATLGNVAITAEGDVTVADVVAAVNIEISGAMSMAADGVTGAAPSNVTFLGTSNAVEDITVDTIGAFSVGTADDAGNVSAGATLTATAGDVNINGVLGAAQSVTLNVGEGVTSVAIGDGATGTGFTLRDDEVNSINTPDFLFDAGDKAIDFTGMVFDTQVGSSTVVFATTGDIDFAGQIKGADRAFRFGGTAQTAGDAPAAEELAGMITMDIEAASAGLNLDVAQGDPIPVTFDFKNADVELRANRIIFGTPGLLTDPALASDSNPADIGSQIVGNGNSVLYRAPPSAYNGPATYLRADNLTVTYQDAALFQNSGEVSSTLVETRGAEISNTLTLDPLDNGPNSFAIFGSIAGISGPDAALSGPTIVIQQSETEVQDFTSRINGCIIGSGAGCLNTIIGVTIVEISPEQLDLLTAEEKILLPFDPLVGTNNEGLFSDVEPQCEKDENGACVQ